MSTEERKKRLENLRLLKESLKLELRSNQRRGTELSKRLLSVEAEMEKIRKSKS
jgi:hypothetical protein